MRPLTKILNQTLTFGGTGEGFSQPNLWDLPDRLIFGGVSGDRETIAEHFESYVRQIYKANGPIFTCIFVRQFVFSEARYRWQDHENGRPSSDLYWTKELRLIDTPWPNGTTGELASHMEQDGSLAGNFFGAVTMDGQRLRRLRPDWVTIVTGSPSEDPFDVEAQPIGYLYRSPRSPEPVLLSPKRVIHYSPLPDPEAQWRGMSWLTPVIDEIKGDKASTKHKLRFFQNGAVPGLAIAYDKTLDRDTVKKYAEYVNEQFGGLDNAYKTLHLGGGADPKPIGANLQQIEFKVTQGAGESRIAAASGLGAVMAQFSEGLQGSSLNTGNFAAARTRAETVLFRPLWRMAAASLQSVLEPPSEETVLTVDTRDVAFLRDDAKSEAEIRQKDAFTIRTLVDAGFKAETVVEAVTTDNFGLLEHTGLFSVQLQPPGQDSQNLVAVPARAVADLVAAGWRHPTEKEIPA